MPFPQLISSSNEAIQNIREYSETMHNIDFIEDDVREAIVKITCSQGRWVATLDHCRWICAPVKYVAWSDMTVRCFARTEQTISEDIALRTINELCDHPPMDDVDSLYIKDSIEHLVSHTCGAALEAPLSFSVIAERLAPSVEKAASDLVALHRKVAADRVAMAANVLCALELTADEKVALIQHVKCPDPVPVHVQLW